ncbi:MAG TPA: tetratricopeptide repeat protein [Bryobacteraceae bacterium]
MRLTAIGTAVLMAAALSFAQFAQSSNVPQNPGASSNTASPSAIAARANQVFNSPNGPALITGRVMVSGDSGPPAERAAIVRVCGGVAVRETYADSHGRFNFQLGERSPVPEAAADGSFSGNGGSRGAGRSGECELRAEVPGYRSDSVFLSDRRGIDTGDVGTIFLHRLTAVHGFTISATTARAPKEARKLYERGLTAIRRDLPDAAQKSFQSAVDLYSKFAAAWFELGRVYERRDHIQQARESYGRAIEVDASYLNPYESLYRLDLKESNWQAAADRSDKVMRLNSYDFPGAFYVNALANLRLHNLDAAERSARKAAEIQGASAQPSANYVLGRVLAEKGEYAESAEALRLYLRHAFAGAERTNAEKLLRQVEHSGALGGPVE